MRLEKLQLSDPNTDTSILLIVYNIIYTAVLYTAVRYDTSYCNAVTPRPKGSYWVHWVAALHAAYHSLHAARRETATRKITPAASNQDLCTYSTRTRSVTSNLPRLIMPGISLSKLLIISILVGILAVLHHLLLIRTSERKANPAHAPTTQTSKSAASIGRVFKQDDQDERRIISSQPSLSVSPDDISR